MNTVSWVVKASKLCNLRCRYCYEWDDLADPRRISPSAWERVFVAARAWAEREARRTAAPVETRFVWHGGEPLLLPPAYVREVLRLGREVFRGAGPLAATVAHCVQTNLFVLRDEVLDLLRSERFRVGVSFDAVPGLRRTAGGAPTETRVARNMDRLRDAGIPFGAITVVARHTLDRLPEIHDFFEDIGVGFRALPLFPAPLNVPGADFAVTRDEMAAALFALFVHWFGKGRPISVDPLDEHLATVLRSLAGLDHAAHGEERVEGVFLVNTDGRLFHVVDAYEDGRELGNVFSTPLETIAASPAWAAARGRAEARIREHCAPCEFRAACSKRPLDDSRLENPRGGRCAIAHPVQRAIAAYLAEGGFGAVEARVLLNDIGRARFAA